MASLPRQFISELHDRNDILSVVSTYVQLKKRGRTHIGLCPFHSEKTPSFNVYPDTESYYCFGCRAGGDVIDFIKRIENLDYLEAVKLLADRAGMSVPELERGEGYVERDVKMKLYAANREAARFFNAALSTPDGRVGLAYLKENRLLNDTTIRAFGLGFAPDSRDKLTQHLRQKGYSPSDLVLANLSFQDRNGKYIDRFRNRVMFPILDVRGNVIAFGGRTMGDDKPKYLNTSDTPVFKKTNNLYALNRAKNSKSDKLILCEGYMDSIALYQAGFDNVVGGLGTALTEEQIRLMSRYCSTVVLCYDADEAGQKAAIRAMKLFDKRGVDTRVIKVPDGKDPDEFLKNHGDNGFYEFSKLVENAQNEVEYVYDSLKQRYNTQTVEGKTKALNEAAHFLAELSSPVKRDVYSGKISEDMGVRRESLDAVISADLRAIEKREKAYDERQEREAVMPIQNIPTTPELQARSTRAAKAEESLAAYLIIHPEAINEVSDRISAENFSMPLAGRIYAHIYDRIQKGLNAGYSEMAGEFSSEEISQIARMLARSQATDMNSSPNICREYADVILFENSKQSAEVLSSQSDDALNAYMENMKNMRREMLKKKHT